MPTQVARPKRTRSGNEPPCCTYRLGGLDIGDEYKVRSDTGRTSSFIVLAKLVLMDVRRICRALLVKPCPL
jgi:hypothetical protein